MLKLLMIVTLVVSFRGLQLGASIVVDHLGLLGVAAAIAGFYGAALFIDRR